MTVPTAPDLIAVGGVTWDAIVLPREGRLIEVGGEQLLAFRHGSKIHLDEAEFAVGGGAANVAVVARRLGLRAAIWGCVGRDATGTAVLRSLQEDGVDVSGVSEDPSAGTGISVILGGPDGDRTVLVHAGANARLNVDDLDLDALPVSGWLYVSSLRGHSGELFDELAARAAAGEVRLALNPGATQIERRTAGLHAALGHCEVLLVNDDEARSMLDVDRTVAVADLARRLREHTAGLVVVTCGSFGSVACTADAEILITAAVPGPIACTVGAGDAFGATVVAAIATGAAPELALRLAAMNATAVIGRYGAHEGALGRAALEEAIAGVPTTALSRELR